MNVKQLEPSEYSETRKAAMKCSCGAEMRIITRTETDEDGEIINKHSFRACDDCGRDTE